MYDNLNMQKKLIVDFDPNKKKNVLVHHLFSENDGVSLILTGNSGVEFFFENKSCFFLFILSTYWLSIVLGDYCNILAECFIFCKCLWFIRQTFCFNFLRSQDLNFKQIHEFRRKCCVIFLFRNQKFKDQRLIFWNTEKKTMSNF